MQRSMALVIPAETWFPITFDNPYDIGILYMHVFRIDIMSDPLHIDCNIGIV